MGKEQQEYEVSNKIITIPNIISFLRLCLVPVFLVLLLDGHNALATFIFALAACTDFVDGQIARRTNSVSKLGQMLDPFVDRVLMISGVVGLLMVDRLPLWIVLFVIIRDVLLVILAARLLFAYKKRVAVIYPGKFATTFLFVGFGGLLLNFPQIQGLGWCDFAWLPGFNAAMSSWGIWFIYLGLALSFCCTIYYIWKGISLKREYLEEVAAAKRAEHRPEEHHGFEEE